MKRALLLLIVATVAGISAMVWAQEAQYPITVIAPGKGPFTFPEGYQTPWDKIEIRVTEKMSPNLFVLHGSQGLDPAHPDGSGGRAMALFGPDGVLMVDTQNRQVAEKTLKALRSFTDAPIRILVNTHVHSDHTGRQRLLRQAGRVDLLRRTICATRCCDRRRAPTASRPRRPTWPAFRSRPTATTPPRRASPP